MSFETKSEISDKNFFLEICENSFSFRYNLSFFQKFKKNSFFTFCLHPKILDKFISHIRKVLKNHDLGNYHKIWAELLRPPNFFEWW